MDEDDCDDSADDIFFLDICRQFIQGRKKEEVQVHGGSVMNRQYIDRDHLKAHDTLFTVYFHSEKPVFDSRMFRRRFRMRRELFMKIMDALLQHDEEFEQKFDSTGKPGISPLSKMTACIRMLAYGCPSDSLDKYLKIGESTVLYYFKRFCDDIIEIFGDEYLRQPTVEDYQRILQTNQERGFPGIIGSIDCMHWEWKNCPTAHHGQYTGKEKAPTLILEAVADYDLWIWHAYFGLPGSLNDINVLNRSPVLFRLAQGNGPEVEYEVNGNTYKHWYYLADGIYPPYATLISTIPNPVTEIQKHFAKMQESARKDVERAFGVLQARFAIVTRPTRFLKEGDIGKVMKTCILLHNMIVEDERGIAGLETEKLFEDNNGIKVSPERPQRETDQVEFSDFLRRYFEIRDTEVHSKLVGDLMKHPWLKKGNN